MPVIPSRLVERRILLGLTQEDVKRALRIRHHQQYAQWETGEHQPTAPYIEKLAKVLRCSADYLLGLVVQPDDVFQDKDLSEDERKLLYLKRQGMINEAVVHLISSSGVPAPLELDNPSRPLIESGNKPEVSDSDPAA